MIRIVQIALALVTVVASVTSSILFVATDIANWPAAMLFALGLVAAGAFTIAWLEDI